MEKFCSVCRLCIKLNQMKLKHAKLAEKTELQQIIRMASQIKSSPEAEQPLNDF